MIGSANSRQLGPSPSDMPTGRNGSSTLPRNILWAIRCYSDRDQAVARQFGLREWIPMMPAAARNVCYRSDLTVLEVISSELIMTVHADRALEVLKKRRR